MLMREMAANGSPIQDKIVDAITAANPILAVIEVFEANAGLAHKFPKLAEVVGAVLRDMNAPSAKMSAKHEIESTDLNALSGNIFVSQDDVVALASGDIKAYRNRYFPAMIQQAGNDLERTLIYAVWQSYSLATEKARFMANSDSGNGYFSITAIRFEEEFSGLAYNPDGSSDASMFDLKALNETPLRNSSDIIGYDHELNSYLAPIIGSDQYISTIFNIDEDNVPDKRIINDTIADVRPGKPGKTKLLMSQYMLNILEDKYGNAITRTTNKTDDFGMMPTYWFGTEIITSEQFGNHTEAFVTAP